MATEEGLTRPTTALALPDEGQFTRDIRAINRFQQVVHSTMVRGLDYGVIPGTQKPTLLKPGAEKIAKLLGLSDQYEIMDRAEDWHTPFFHYLIKCRLVHVASGAVISEGLGECNSMESKYRYRWVGERDLPSGVDKSKLVSQERHSKTGGHWTVFRLDNEDIYSQVNTILKMSKKRALVDAALSAGRLSDVFTQDLEDMREVIESEAREETPPKAKSPLPDSPATNGSTGKAEVIEPPEATASTRTQTATPARDISSIKTFGDLYPACARDFGLKTRRDVWKEYGVTSQEEIFETPAEVYLKIAAVRANKGGEVVK